MINRVPNAGWNEYQRIKTSSYASQIFQNLQNGRRFPEAYRVTQIIKSGMSLFQLILPQKSLPCFGLHSRKLKQGFPISLYNESHCCITKIAYTIEKYNSHPYKLDNRNSIFADQGIVIHLIIIPFFSHFLHILHKCLYSRQEFLIGLRFFLMSGHNG